MYNGDNTNFAIMCVCIYVDVFPAGLLFVSVTMQSFQDQSAENQEGDS